MPKKKNDNIVINVVMDKQLLKMIDDVVKEINRNEINGRWTRSSFIRVACLQFFRSHKEEK